MQSVNSFIRTQGITCAIANMILNPAIAWLGNRQMNFESLNDIVVDTAITSVILSLLVTLFTASGTRQALHAGRLQVSDGSPRAGRLLSHLPKEAWALGLLIGFVVACIFTPLVYGMFHALGLSGLPFAGFALFKVIYTGPLGFLVTRWVILRQLLNHSLETSGASDKTGIAHH